MSIKWVYRNAKRKARPSPLHPNPVSSGRPSSPQARTPVVIASHPSVLSPYTRRSHSIRSNSQSLIQSMRRTNPHPLTFPPSSNTSSVKFTQTLHAAQLITGLKLFKANHAFLLPALRVETILLRSAVDSHATRSVYSARARAGAVGRWWLSSRRGRGYCGRGGVER